MLRRGGEAGAAVALVAVLDAGVPEVAGVAELDARGGAVVREEGRDDAGEDTGGYIDRARVDGRPVERDGGRVECEGSSCGEDECER